MKIASNSSLRKLDRAMRRGEVPDERQVIIDTAVKNAERRRLEYMHRAARQREESER